METKQPKVSFIPCLTWVRRGVANPKLEKVKPSKQELQEIMKELKLREAEYQSRPKLTDSDSGDVAADNKENDDDDEDNAAVDDFYDMDNYDDEAVEPPGISSDIGELINNIQGDSDAEEDQDDLDSDEEPDEFMIKPDDNLIVCGHVDGDVCMLEVYVFNNDKGEFFIHNDMFLPSYPICLEWLDFNPKKTGQKGHYAAVGCMTPEIGVWDLNVTGCLEPAFKLGTKKKKTMRHSDAVLDLAWHKDNRQALASGSADQTVILWDLANTAGVTKIESFEEKVQSLQWHPFETQSLLTGCCDKKVRLFDCRNPKYFKTWAFDGEIERILWNTFDPLYYFATTDKGMVYYVDSRTTNPVWTLKAHDKEVTGIALSSYCKDLLMTGSMDEVVKVWDLQGGQPTFVTQKNMGIGNIYTLASCPDVPYVFCAGGSRKDNYLYLWDSRESDPVMDRFRGRRFEEIVIKDESEGMDIDRVKLENPQPSTSKNSNSEGRIVQKVKSSKNKELASSVSQQSSSTKKKSKKNKSKSHKNMHPKTNKDSGPPPGPSANI